MDTNITRDQGMDLHTIKKASGIDGTEASKIVGSDWMNPQKTQNVPQEQPTPTSTVSVEEPDVPVLNTPQNLAAESKSYNGPGLILEKTEEEPKPEFRPGYTGVTPETQSNVDKYLAEMDDEIEKMEASKAESESTEEDEVEEDKKEMTESEFNDQYKEAVVLIDKTGFGTIINFTDEEREKLERSKKIKLEEVETLELNTIKTKKIRKGKDINNIIKHVTNVGSANIVLPASGYTAVMKGCSAHEIVTLLKGAGTILTDLQTKWSLIYDKMESCSLGKMSYNDFLLNTASIDKDVFIYGILCATFPDDDTIPLNCQKCSKQFDHSYSIRSLIRAEKMEDRIKELISNAVDSSVIRETAKANHEKAPVSLIKRIKLPVSEIICDMYVQSAYDLINKSAKELTEENRETRYEEASILSVAISKMYIPDDESNDGSYYEVDGAMDVVKTIYALSNTDNEILTKVANDLLEGLTIEFGLMNVTCPSCKHYTASIPLDIEQILFYRYQQERTTTVE